MDSPGQDPCQDENEEEADGRPLGGAERAITQDQEVADYDVCRGEHSRNP